MIDIKTVKDVVFIPPLPGNDDYLVTKYADGDTITSMMDCFLEVMEYCPDEHYYELEPMWTHKGIGLSRRFNGTIVIIPPPPDCFFYPDINLSDIGGK